MTNEKAAHNLFDFVQSEFWQRRVGAYKCLFKSTCDDGISCRSQIATAHFKQVSIGNKVHIVSSATIFVIFQFLGRQDSYTATRPLQPPCPILRQGRMKLRNCRQAIYDMNP